MKLSSRRLPIAGLIILTSAALAACSSAGGSATSPPSSASTPASASSGAAPPSGVAALVAGSKHEPGLLIYGNPPAQLWTPVIKAFNQQYPWIKVTAEDVDDTVVFSKYAAEHSTGARTADILVASAPNLWQAAKANGDLMHFTPAGISNFPSFASQGSGLYILSPDPAITIYNKVLLKGQAPPDTIAALAASPDKVVTYTVNNTFGYSAFWGYVNAHGWPALDQIGKSAKIAADGGTMLNQVAQGGYQVGLFESGLTRGAIETSLKSVMGWEYTKDYTPLIPRGIGITAGASSPDSAKLFLDFMFSNAGQQVMCDAGFTAYSNTFTPSDGCPNTLAAVYAAVGQQHAVLIPIGGPVASDQAAFTARWHQAFKNS